MLAERVLSGSSEWGVRFLAESSLSGCLHPLACGPFLWFHGASLLSLLLPSHSHGTPWTLLRLSTWSFVTPPDSAR